MRRPILRPFLLGLGLLAGLVALLILAGLFWLRSSLPITEGELRVDGLRGEVLIRRDRWGVPHVRAQGREDALFALGFVHAQDRLFSLEMMRRYVDGRLSEVLGPRALAADRRSRFLGLGERCDDEVARLDEGERAGLRAYARGIDAAVARQGRSWSLRLLRAPRPAPWRPRDTAALVLYMDDSLVMDGGEAALAELVRRTGDEAAARWLWNGEPEETPATRPGPGRGGAAFPGGEGSGPRPPVEEPARGSNAWAVDGRWTATGAPLLANDAHLSPELPALFYLADLQWPGGRRSGFTLPGGPVVVAGTNGAVAWGVTTCYADALDRLAVDVLPDSSACVLRGATDQAVVPLRRREAVIPVKGAAPDTLRWRVSPLGPLVVDEEGAWLRRWVRDEAAGTLAAMLRLQESRRLEEAAAALEDWAGPAHNLVLADTLGAAGRVGWVPAGRWFDHTDPDPRRPLAKGRPRLLPAATGLVVSANQRAARGRAGAVMSAWWPLPWRALAIRDGIGKGRPLDADAFARLQLDTGLPEARRWVRWLDRVPRPDDLDPDVAALWDRLSRWDGRAEGGASPTLHRLFTAALARELFAPHWPDLWEGDGLLPRASVHRGLLKACGLLGEQPLAEPLPALDRRDWFDDPRTAAVETAGERVAAALRAARQEAVARFGADEEGWRWDRVHTLTVAHPLASIPLLGDRLVLGPVSLPGDGDAILACAGSLPSDLRVTHAPVMRMVLDLADPGRSRFALAGGQVDHPSSAHFGDLFGAWARGESLALLEGSGRTGEDSEVPRPAEGDPDAAVLRLSPRTADPL